MVNFALDNKNPFIRLPNLPSKDIATCYSHMFRNVSNNSNLLEVEKFNNNFHKISEKMKLSLDEEFIDMILKSGSHIKFITDAPIEWIKHSGVPLGLIKSISRLPIIPGNTLVNVAKLTFKEYILKQDVSFLIINTLNPQDPLYGYGNRLGQLLKNYFPDNSVHYFEITNKSDFIKTLNDYQSTFFIYYGHGSIPMNTRNISEQVGKLHIGNEEIDMINLENNIKKSPLITILGACQTQVLNSHYLNIGNMFLGLGSKSVLATYFPVDGFYTFSLIESIFRHLRNYFEGSTPKYIKNWSDIILQARRTHYITEPTNTIIEYLIKKGDKIEVNRGELNQFVMKYCIESGKNNASSYIEIMERSVLYRSDAYKKYFEEYPEKTKKLVDYVLKHNYVFPESIIFTSLGSPENIEFI